MSGVTLYREVDALGGAGSDQWEIGYNAGIRDALAVLEKRGFCETADASAELVVALQELADVFALSGESSVARFDRLAAMFHRDTGYMAPGKDQPASGVVSSADRDGLNALYDAWYQAKVDRARAALAKATAT